MSGLFAILIFPSQWKLSIKSQQFILSTSKSKEQSSSSRDESSKRSLADFNLMVEYCEESGCRRKKILESFGEQAPLSLCKKTCDSCKHPNLVAKYLEELTTSCAFHHRNGSSRIFISSSNLIDEGQLSEFWNRDDEKSGSEEDISDSDDAIHVAESLVRTSLPPKSRLNEKIELLQRAEESYYRNKIPDKQPNKLNKNAISETHRETSKQRLSNALKQTQQRLGNLKIDLETSASFLENECYKKYGKSGKSFYCSQVASTVRWLSTTNATELTNRVGANSSSVGENKTIKVNSSSTLAMSDCSMETSREEIHGTLGSGTSSSAPQSNVPSIVLPPIPSLSEFINSKKSKDKSPGRVHKSLDKRMRLQKG